jgi:hypothetical protein
MALPYPVSTDTNKRLCIALTSQNAGNETYNALNAAVSQQYENYSSFAFVNNATTSTTQIPGLLPGDLVYNLKTVASNTASNIVVVTAGTIPYAPSAGDVLMVLRPNPIVTPTTFQF